MSLFLVALLLPVLGATFCPCAEANPSEQLLLQNVPCQHCCPESNLLKSECQPAVIASATPLESQGKTGNLRPELQVIPASPSGSYFEKPVGLSGPQPQISQSETYLILQVLRL